jgi:hypothetical protein
MTTYLKHSWFRLKPSFSTCNSTADTSQLTELETVLRTGVLDPVVLGKHVRGIAVFGPNERTVKEAQVRGVLKLHVGSRCAFEIALRTTDGWNAFVAKIYRKDRSDIFQVMQGIEQAGFGLRDEFSIPQPLAYIPSLHCLLQEKVQGMRADEVFKVGDERASAVAAEQCAVWLARFHAFAPKAGRALYADEFLNSKSMHRYSLEIAKRSGRCAEKSAYLLRRLEDALPSLSPLQMCAGHGSYTAAHVMLAPGRAVTIDWDGYDVADPARDVARFLAALRRPALGRFGSIRGLDGTAEVFRETYLKVGRPEVKENLRFFEAATCLNLARHTLCRPFPLWQEKQDKAEAMLDEGLAVLDGETVQ